MSEPDDRRDAWTSPLTRMRMTRPRRPAHRRRPTGAPASSWAPSSPCWWWSSCCTSPAWSDQVPTDRAATRRAHDPVDRLNQHHADDVLAVAQVFAGCPEAVHARVVALDASGLLLDVEPPCGPLFLELARRARAAGG